MEMQQQENQVSSEEEQKREVLRLGKEWLAADVAAERPSVAAAWHYMCRVPPHGLDGIIDMYAHIWDELGEDLAVGHITPLEDEDVDVTAVARYGTYAALAAEYGLLMWPLIALTRPTADDNESSLTPRAADALKAWDAVWTKYRQISTAKHIETRALEEAEEQAAEPA